MKSRILCILPIILLAVLTVTSCTGSTKQETPPAEDGKQHAVKKRVLYVDSYHQEFEWIRTIMEGLFSKLKISWNRDGTFDDTGSPVDLEVIHLDTKRNPDDEWGERAGLSANRFIDSWKPDILLTSDDNAIRYLVSPHLADSRIPLVFSGVNWDISVYGLPTGNMTGMLEVLPVKKVMEILLRYSRGNRIGLIAERSETEEKNLPYIRAVLGNDIKVRLVRSIGEFKDRFLELQNECDMILISIFQNIDSFDKNEIYKFLLSGTRVPTGTVYDFLAPYVLVSCAVTGEEQGEFLADAALRILGGTPPAEIPIVTNRRAKILLNMKLAAKLDIVFPMDLIEQSIFVEEILSKSGSEAP